MRRLAGTYGSARERIFESAGASIGCLVPPLLQDSDCLLPIFRVLATGLALLLLHFFCLNLSWIGSTLYIIHCYSINQYFESLSRIAQSHFLSAPTPDHRFPGLPSSKNAQCACSFHPRSIHLFISCGNVGTTPPSVESCASTSSTSSRPSNACRPARVSATCASSACILFSGTGGIRKGRVYDGKPTGLSESGSDLRLVEGRGLNGEGRRSAGWCAASPRRRT